MLPKFVLMFPTCYIDIMNKNSSILMSNNPINEDLFICEAGYEQCTSTKPNEHITIDYNVIHYCLKGHGTLIINDHIYDIKAGDLFIIPANTNNIYFPDHHDPWFYRWVGIKGKHTDKYLSLINLDQNNPVLHYQVDPQLDNLFQQVYIDFKNNYRIKTLGSTFYLLHYLEHRISIQNLETLTPSEALFKKASNYFYTHYQEDINIDEVAKNLNIDRSYLFKIFKKYSHQSPSQYLKNIRIEKACLLLKRSNLPITTIACNVGFNSSSYFTKSFVSIKQMSPKEYRNLHTNK